jgi:hypothetical protein
MSSGASAWGYEPMRRPFAHDHPDHQARVYFGWDVVEALQSMANLLDPDGGGDEEADE